MLVVQDKSNLLKLYALDGFLRRDFDEDSASELESALDRKDNAQAEASADRPKSEEAAAGEAASGAIAVCMVDGKRTHGNPLASIQLAFTCLYINVHPAEYSLAIHWGLASGF